MSGAREKYLDAGLDDYISKPFNRDQLFAAVAAWTGARGRARKSALGPPLGDDTAADGEVPLLDSARLVALVESLPPEKVRQFIETYLESAASLTAALAQAAAVGDLAGMGAAAHDLVSTSGAIGAQRLFGLAQNLDRACRNGAAQSAHSLAAAAGDVAGLTAAALRAQLAVPAPA